MSRQKPPGHLLGLWQGCNQGPVSRGEAVCKLGGHGLTADPECFWLFFFFQVTVDMAATTPNPVGLRPEACPASRPSPDRSR